MNISFHEKKVLPFSSCYWWAQEAQVTLRRTACLCGSSFSFASCSRFPFQGNLVGSRSSSHSPTYRVLMRVFFFFRFLRFPQIRGNLVGSSGLEPPTSRLSGARSSLLSYEPVSFPVVLPVSCPSLFGGDDGIRTHDPLLAGQVLSQLSYTPVMGPLPCAGSRGPSKLNNKSGLFRSRRFPWVFFSVKTSSAPLGAPLALFQASLFSIERR